MDRDEFSLGRFRLDMRQRQLTRDGIPVQLSSRALDVLCVLAGANGEVVSKDELMTRVWPGVVVEENNIQVHVSALRKALDDGKSGETYLMTVPGRGYRLVGLKVSRPGSDGTLETSPLHATSNQPLIAVLPFQNMSGDPEQEYFADGMVEEIITGLSRIKWLSVVSRNSSFIYKNKPVTITEVAEKFGVRYVLEGGVRKAGNRVRITAQLIDAKTDTHLWADQYDRVLEDVFALQDDMTMCVVGAIEPSLRKAEVDRVKRQRPTNLNAYDLLLRALPFVLTHIPSDSVIAVPLLEEALALQPDYAAAHAFLSRCLHHRYSRTGRREEDLAAAIRHARSAVAYGSDDATALAVAAQVIAMDAHDTATAVNLFERALELSNSNIFALSLSAMVLALMGKAERAIERAERAILLSPFDSYNFRSHHALAIAHFSRQRYKAAVDAARKMLDYNPRFSVGHAYLAAALLRDGRAAEAKSAARDVLQLEPTFTIRGLRGAELLPALFGSFADAWRELELPE
jgi:TolB-like protein/Flp pilus assembly protein TadD